MKMIILSHKEGADIWEALPPATMRQHLVNSGATVTVLVPEGPRDRQGNLSWSQAVFNELMQTNPLITVSRVPTDLPDGVTTVSDMNDLLAVLHEGDIEAPEPPSDHSEEQDESTDMAPTDGGPDEPAEPLPQ